MSKKLTLYKGLFGDDQLPYMPDFIHTESLEFRSKTYNWEISDHTHSDLFQMFLIKNGEGVFVANGAETRIVGPAIITIPANNLHGFHFQSDIKGEVITVSDAFLDGILRDTPLVQLSVNQMTLSRFDESDDDWAEIVFVTAKIQRELIEEQPEKQMGIKSYFEILFLLLYRKRLLSEVSDLPTTHKSLAYYQDFKKLVKQSLQNPLSIKEYAQALGITQMHLNRVCHAVVQESALKVVQQYILGEAKKYLLNTSYSISEISYFLNFTDPAYFSRLFKKWVGVSPSEFRRE